ncbi:MAG TPA: DUF5996 family protein [Anaerolineaceae bacterium]|nr:DUF5996 family protein [Anaerolineaceae bacterium]
MHDFDQGSSVERIGRAAALGDSILLYDNFRTAVRPAEALLDSAQSTYEAGANLGKWEHGSLELISKEKI